MSGEPKVYDLKEKLKEQRGKTLTELRQEAQNANSIPALKALVQELIIAVFGKQE